MVVIDTNIIIDHIRQPNRNDSYYSRLVEKELGGVFAISIISLQELYVGQSLRNKEHERYVLSTISALEFLSYTYEIAQLAGEITRDANRAIGFADAAIAATAILNDAQLFTLNRKDFEGIKGLELVNI